MLEFMPGTPFNDEKLTEAQRALLRGEVWIGCITAFTRFFNYLKLAII